MNKIKCTNCGEENIQGNKFCNKCGHELPVPVVEEKKFDPFGDVIEKIKANKRKNRLAMIFGIIAGVFVISGYIYFVVFGIMDNVINLQVQQQNATCPMMIDEYTRLESVHVVSKKKIKYSYTLVEWEKEQLNLDTVRSYMEPSIMENIRTNPQLAFFKMKDVTFVYSYNDKNDVPVWEYTVTPEMYKNE
jgi:hypothetical protein